jgi:NADH:ubiquinone oxidoreductase subunit F (NADH-binding)
VLPITVTQGRVLPAEPVADLDAYVARGGGRALPGARAVEPAAVIATIADAGLRGRGGAGFPTGTKWATVAENRSSVVKASVVVNAAEGEPWTEKDRAILLADPYQVLEGALVAAHAIGAGEVVVALRGSFADVHQRVVVAIAEARDAGWFDPEQLNVRAFLGPEDYLYGEETGMLEALDGRPPLPRIAPPFRRGATDVVDDDRTVLVNADGGDNETEVPPTLVDNVETLAHAAWIVADGPDAFRALGTDATPGTVVCTVTGLVGPPRGDHGGVGEVPAGTTIRDAIEQIAGGITPGVELGAVVLGASTRPLRPEELDLPLCFDAMAAAGAGLGSATLHVVAKGDVLATVAGVSRFLAVESCGQCEPCQRDGLALAATLEQLCSGEPAPDEVVIELQDRTGTVADGARCALARQHEALLSGLLARFPGEIHLHQQGRRTDIPAVGDRGLAHAP